MFVQNKDSPPQLLMIEWIVAHGGSINQCRLTNRTIICTSKTDKYEELFKIPKEICMTVDKALELHPEIDPSFSPSLILILFLALEREKGKESFWFPYIESLPKNDSFVDDWAPQLLETLGLSILVQGKSAEIRSSYSSLVDFDSFRWAFWMVESRSFLNRFSNISCDPVMIPFADMLNHLDCRADSAEFSCDMFSMVADRNIQSGDAVFNSYGRRTNRELILSYGFALEKNCWEYVALKNLPSHHISDRESLFLYESPVPNKSLVNLFRISVADQTERTWIQNNQNTPVSFENESKAIEKLREVLRSNNTWSTIDHPYLNCKRNILKAHLEWNYINF